MSVASACQPPACQRAALADERDIAFDQLVVAHQRLRDAPVPINDDLSVFHRQLRRTADRVISASSDDKRRYYFARLLDELDIYQQKLQLWEASPQVTEPVRRLMEMLHKYQHVLTNS